MASLVVDAFRLPCQMPSLPEGFECVAFSARATPMAALRCQTGKSAPQKDDRESVHGSFQLFI